MLLLCWRHIFGKGLVQRIVYLSDGSIIKITTEEWYTPRDKQIHEIGIEPDIKIEITKEDIEKKKILNLKSHRVN